MSDVLGFELPNALLEPTPTTSALPFDGSREEVHTDASADEPAVVGSGDDTVH
jgi:hypothetical protein